MIHINDNDLEASLRTISAQTGHTLTNIARALMRIGLKAKPTAINAEIAARHRPLGRPPALSPKTPKEPEETPEQQKKRLKKESDHLQYGTPMK